MLPLAKKVSNSHQDEKICYISGKMIFKILLIIKTIEKLGTIVILQVKIEAQCIVFAI